MGTKMLGETSMEARSRSQIFTHGAKLRTEKVAITAAKRSGSSVKHRPSGSGACSECRIILRTLRMQRACGYFLRFHEFQLFPVRIAENLQMRKDSCSPPL